MAKVSCNEQRSQVAYRFGEGLESSCDSDERFACGKSCGFIFGLILQTVTKTQMSFAKICKKVERRKYASEDYLRRASTTFCSFTERCSGSSSLMDESLRFLFERVAIAVGDDRVTALVEARASAAQSKNKKQ